MPRPLACSMGGKGLGHRVMHQRVHRGLGQLVIRPLKQQQSFVAHTKRFMNQGSEHDGRQVVVLEPSYRFQSKNFFCEVLKGTGRISLQCCRREAPFRCRNGSCAPTMPSKGPSSGDSRSMIFRVASPVQRGAGPVPAASSTGRRIVALQQATQGQFLDRQQVLNRRLFADLHGSAVEGSVSSGFPMNRGSRIAIAIKLDGAMTRPVSSARWYERYSRLVAERLRSSNKRSSSSCPANFSSIL